MTLQSLIYKMQELSLAEVRQATREQRAKFAAVANGIMSTISAENAHDDAEMVRRNRAIEAHRRGNT